ncbi:ATP-binding protein [Tissierella praeacuta]|uniref:ATP-binding protein n=1 Tax=Tissierella praeacuta TaxID=43131 RepID=UPI0033426EAC
MINHKKPEIRHIISIAISIIIGFTVISRLLIINFFNEDIKYISEKGVLNLDDWRLDEEENIKLDGEWEFYPGILLEPKEIKTNKFKEYEKIRKYVRVPGSWESYLNEDGSIDGSGTYRLIIKVPEDRIYGIKTRTIRSASRIYLNGQEVAHTGITSIRKEGFKPESKYKIGIENSLNKELELIIQVSSYEYRAGGILKSIYFGSSESIMKDNNKSRALDALVISGCLIIGIRFFIIALQRNRERSLAYFSGANFFMGLYLSTMNEQLLDLIYNYDFITRTRIQTLAMIMSTACFLQFIHHFFKEYSNEKIIKKITGFMLLLMLFIFNNPEEPLSIPIGIQQILIIIGYTISYIYIFYILLKAIYNKAYSLEYILIITTSIFSYWFITALKIFLEIDLGNIPIMLILLMMISVASLMSHRLQLDYQEANSLSEKLIRYDRLKDEFLAKASHEMKTPLHVMLNLAKNLLEGKNGSLNFRQQEDLLFIYQEGQRLTRLVEDILDASQIKKGEIKLRLGSIEPYKIVGDMLNEMKCLIPENKTLSLKNQIPRVFPTLKADSDKFRQIIYNLVHNAIKYTKHGEIAVSASVIDGQVEIRISDTGIGIEEKYFKEVFDIFYQKNEEGQMEPGLGLGLSIVKYLVESQGGRIWVESIYGKGSTFKFTLPIYTGKEEDKKKMVSTKENILKPITSVELSPKMERENKNYIGRPKILIVDDEPLNQKILWDLMEELELNAILAYSGKEALNIVEKNKIDLIILDFMLSDMSGEVVCKEIRQKYSMAELPILILTASGRTIDLMNAFDYGANDFQRKPVDAEELKSRIQSLLLMKKSVEEGLEKEFQYFYSQISPHFLYNTLNTIIGLSYKDDEKARKALSNLSIYFRGKLDLHRKKGLITLESELELIIAYLEIEQMRYGERLEIEYDIEEGLSAMIPPLTLQPIVENSVRHGIVAKNRGGKIKISVKKEDTDFINIVIEDNGRGMPIEKQQELLKGNSQRVGFTNVLKKIKILKGAELTLESKIDEGTKVKIVIPEVKYHESYFS